MYSIMNIASYYALARVDASVYTVLGQLKTLTTAAFSVLFLSKNISSAKWRSLVLLVLGCVLVASPTFNKPIECASTQFLDETEEGQIPLSIVQAAAAKHALNTSTAAAKSTSLPISLETESVVSPYDAPLGILACLVMVTLSGLSVTYFETLYSTILMLFLNIYVELVYNPMYADSAVATKPYVMFKGWTIFTVLIALVQALGGLLVAATLKYADAVLKTLATSGSIVMSTVLGYVLLKGQCDVFVVI
eukprot:gene31004-38316_t